MISNWELLFSTIYFPELVSVKKTTFLLLVILLRSHLANAQEMWGISNSNYAGNMGIFLNPSSIVGAPYKYEINLIALDVFLQNNYVYVPKKDGIILNAITGNVGDENIAQDNYDGRNTNAFGHLLLIGPSYIRNLDEKAWGIHSAYRNEFSLQNAPSHFSKFVYEKYEYPQGFGIRNSSDRFNAAWLGWVEVGGTYGKVLRESENHYLKAAATVNLLVGMNAAYLDIRNFDYTVLDTSVMVLHNVDATFAHSSGNSGSGAIFGFRGLGLGTTLGLTYIHKRRTSGYECRKIADNVKKYNYRIGVSLMDLGLIHFFKDATKLEASTSSDRIWNGIDSANAKSTDELGILLSNQINGSYTAESKNFSMITPTAISIQFDYAFTPRVFANASWVNRLHFAPNQIARGNQLNLSLRYEKRRWEVNGNVSLFEYQRPAMGVGFRYAFFVIGTDRLLEWINLSDVYTFDFFFGIKFNLCNLTLRSRDPDCPAFGYAK